jgi:hypothetical protein
LKQYIAAGLDPARFWELTPRLYVVEMEGAADRAKVDRAMVWYGAMLPHFKKPPSFDDFVSPAKRKERQDPEIMQSMLEALAAAWGAERIH